MTASKTSLSSAEQGSAKISQYWEHQFAKNRIDKSLWTNNEIVVRNIYRLISDGTEEHWLPWFLHRYLSDPIHFRRSLSVCCGDGAHELALANSGRVGFTHGFDLSEGAIAQAIAAFEGAGRAKESYRFEVANADDLQIDGEFDLMLSTGALHHVTNLEGLLSRLRKMLAPDGYFLVLEYVGPNRFQWRDRQVSVINAILQQLDTRFLRNHQRVVLSPPPLAEFLAIDPSEAVRPEDILSLLQEYFEVEYLRNFNGTVMHPLYPLLNEELTNAGAADFDSIVRLILLMEEMLIRENVIASDFAFAICRQKEDSNKEPLSLAPRYVGYIDFFDGSRVEGWAANTSDLNAVVEVDLCLDGERQMRVRCGGFRQDLKDAGYGDGRKSFEANVGSAGGAIANVATITVAGSNRTIATAQRSAGAAR